MTKRFIFKIKLKNVAKPPVWRRVEVPATISFKKFSDVILESMGWAGGHLWQFSSGVYEGRPIAIPNEDDWEEPVDARKTKLNKVFDAVGKKFIYTYDFGDDWIHEVVLEEIIDSKTVNCVVLAAKGKCPPEDCGGPYGYERIKAILADPKSEEYNETLEWLCPMEGMAWNPKEADVAPGTIVGEMDYDDFF